MRACPGVLLLPGLTQGIPQNPRRRNVRRSRPRALCVCFFFVCFVFCVCVCARHTLCCCARVSLVQALPLVAARAVGVSKEPSTPVVTPTPRRAGSLDATRSLSEGGKINKRSRKSSEEEEEEEEETKKMRGEDERRAPEVRRSKGRAAIALVTELTRLPFLSFLLLCDVQHQWQAQGESAVDQTCRRESK